jgi:peptide/nickel transport system permease protein
MRFVLKRLLTTVLTLVGISIAIFFIVRLLPGDVVDVVLGGDQSASAEVKREARERLGLTGSYPAQYWRWASSFVRGDFGFSYRNTQPVSEILFHALPITAQLVIFGLLIAVVIGLPLGVLSAVRRDTRHDYAARVGGLIGISIPSFWLATLLLLLTSRVFGWVPPLTYTPIYKDPVKNLSEFILPAISISVFTLAIVMRMVRATMLEVLGQDYVRTARAKGAKPRAVISRHALRNALIPVVTVVGFEIGILMGGSAIVEIIFGLPGVGNTLINAIFNRDYPVVQAATMILAVVFVLSNLVVDMLYGYLDPRISQS